MRALLDVPIQPQPDDTTCGPTCLEAVYAYYGKHADLPALIHEVERLEGGGTLGVHLARHALRAGFAATIYSYNLRVFDPSWSHLDRVGLIDRLETQARVRSKPKVRATSKAYVDFLHHGGRVSFAELDVSLLTAHLAAGRPIITGLSATYLHRSPREIGETNKPDDILGEPVGHFVVLCGIDPPTRRVLVADPLDPNPAAANRTYEVSIDRLIGAIFLGALTYDANMLVIEPRRV